MRTPRQLGAARRGLLDGTPVGEPLDTVLPAFGDDYSELEFLNRLGDLGWRTESRAVALCEVYSFAGWLATTPTAGTATVFDVTARVIAAYRDHLLHHGLSVATTRLALVCLRLYYDFLTETEVDPAANPARHISLPDRDLPATHPYTDTEVHTIFSHLTDQACQAWTTGDLAEWMSIERDYAMLMVLYYAGLRRGEVRRLRLRDLNLTRAEMQVRGKGGKARTITVPTLLIEALERYLAVVRGNDAPDAFVFCELDPATVTWHTAGADADRADHRYLTDGLVGDARGEDSDYGLGPYTLTNAAHRHARAAGVDGPHYAHRWRHTHASRCAEGGMSLGALAARLGHSVEERKHGLGWNPITLDYIHLSADYLHRVVNQALTDPLADEALVHRIGAPTVAG